MNRSVNFKRVLTSHAHISLSEMYSGYVLITKQEEFALFNNPLISSVIKERHAYGTVSGGTDLPRDIRT